MTPVPQTPTDLKRQALFLSLQAVRAEIAAIDERISGLGFTDKDQREAKFEELKAEREAKGKEEMSLMEQLRELVEPPPAQ